MNLWENIIVALEGIKANKLRSFLTTLGIIIGIAAVIAVVAIGQGGRALVIREMEKIGTNIFAVYIDWRSDDPPTGEEFDLFDVTAIKEQVPEVKYLAPESSAYESVRAGNKTKSASIVGTTADWKNIRNKEMAQGRFLSEADCLSGKMVAVLEEDLAKEFFRNQDPIGQRIVARGCSLVVVGVLQKETSMFEGGGLASLYIPFRAWQTLYPDGYIDTLEGSAASRETVAVAVDKTVKILERRHHAPAGRYIGETLESEMASADRIMGIMTLVIGAIAGISLFVGGVGVMNIMLVSVTERVREIGLRKALGARRKDIMIQFLIEAMVLCFLGGAIGTGIGVGGAYLIARIAKWPPLMSWWTILIAFVFSTGVGIVFGLLPANKASKLDPIEALRRD